MNCLLCLNINESGKKSFNSDEWKELNIQYIVEKYLWKMENLNNHSYICQECWQELHNFHNFYLKIEKAHLNLNILVKSEVASEDVSSNKEDLGAQFFIDNENHKIQPEILFVNIESPLKIVEVGEVICSKRTNDKKTIPKNYTKKIFKKEKDTTAINKPEYKEDSAKHNCIDSKENFQIEREILFIKEESPLEIFEKEDVEEVSSLKNTTKRKRHLMKNTNDKKNICKNNPKKIFRREDTTVINKPECKGGPAEQICIEHKENSQIEPEILLLEEDNPLEMFEKECMGEVSSLKNTTKRKRPLRKSANNKKNIAKNKQKKRLKKEKVTKSEDNKNHDEEIDIKLKEVEYDPKSNKIDEHLNDQKDIFVSDVDHSSNSIDSSKLEQSNQEQDKFIYKHFQIACSLCDIPLATFEIMAKHYKEQHSQHGYATCCDQKLFSRLEIVNHIKIHQNAEYFKCKICDKVSVTRSCLRQHIKDTHKKKNVECDICGKSLANASSLRTHKLMHEADNKNKIHCELCDKSYLCKHSLNIHMRLFHLKEHIICDLCGKSLRDSYRLKVHMLEHEGKPKSKVSCEVCGRILSDVPCLKRHIRSYHPPNGVNPEFNCPVCKKLFTSNANLKMHVRRVHESKYERKCTLCGKIFKRPAGLKDHMASHAGKPLRACTFCSRIFYSNGNMYAHRKRAHPIEWAESVREKNYQIKKITKTIEN